MYGATTLHNLPTLARFYSVSHQLQAKGTEIRISWWLYIEASLSVNCWSGNQTQLKTKGWKADPDQIRREFSQTETLQGTGVSPMEIKGTFLHQVEWSGTPCHRGECKPILGDEKFPWHINYSPKMSATVARPVPFQICVTQWSPLY